jgi:hypothetical protein
MSAGRAVVNASRWRRKRNKHTLTRDDVVLGTVTCRHWRWLWRTEVEPLAGGRERSLQAAKKAVEAYFSQSCVPNSA